MKMVCYMRVNSKEQLTDFEDEIRNSELVNKFRDNYKDYKKDYIKRSKAAKKAAKEHNLKSVE